MSFMLNPDTPETRKKLERQLNYYDGKKAELQNNISAIRSGDLSYIQKNSENLAKQLYMSQKLDDYVNAFAHEDIEQEIKFDQVALSIYKEQEEWKRTKYKEDRADERESKKQEQLIPVAVPGEQVQTYNKDNLVQKLKSSEVALRSAHVELKDHIANITGAGTTGTRITDAQVQSYIRNNPNDKMVPNYVK